MRRLVSCTLAFGAALLLENAALAEDSSDAPCMATLGGRQRFALSHEGGEPIAAPETLSLSPGKRVEGEYEDNAGWRQAGWIVLGVGVTGGLAVIATGVGLLADGGSSERRAGAATVAGGAAATVLSLAMGLTLVLRGDEAHVYVSNAR